MNTPEADLKAIFCEALDQLAGPERSAYLDRACGANVTVRRQLESLLKAHDEAGGFLGSSSRNPAAAPASVQVAATSDHSAEPELGRAAGGDRRAIAEGSGTIIGPYKLLQQIGEGGFGVVYMAEQERPVRRIIALKIIKPGMDTAQVIARFESERQALALMDHPNIAKVFDAGNTSHSCEGGVWGGGFRGTHRSAERLTTVFRSPVLRDGAGQGHPDHRVLRQEPLAAGRSTQAVRQRLQCHPARPSQRFTSC